MNKTASGSGWAEGALDIYETWIHFAYTRKGATYLRKQNPSLKENALDGGGWTTSSIHSETGMQHLWVYVNLTDTSMLGLVNVLAHEATHMGEMISNACSMPFSGEPAAYLVGYISGWMLAQIPKDLIPE